MLKMLSFLWIIQIWVKSGEQLSKDHQGPLAPGQTVTKGHHLGGSLRGACRLAGGERGARGGQGYYWQSPMMVRDRHSAPFYPVSCKHDAAEIYINWHLSDNVCKIA